MPAKRKAKSKAKRKAPRQHTRRAHVVRQHDVKAKTKRKTKTGKQRLVITLNENGKPHRRAEIWWPAGKPFTLNHLVKHRDCARWVIPPGWFIRITNGDC